MTNFPDPDYLAKIDKVWGEHSIADTGWHGYALLTKKGGVVVTAFLDLSASPEPLIELFSENHLRLPQIVHIERFSQIETGTESNGFDLFHPGSLLFTTYSDANCPEGCHGTLGALVTDDTGPIWMLSNKHILANNSDCVKNVEVRGIGSTLLTKEAFPSSSANVDAAIARVPDGERVFPVYPGIDITCGTPLLPPANTNVQKLGNATGLTSGIFIGCCLKVLISPCDKSSAVSEFSNQLIIASQPDKAEFLAKGDSGSLVIGSHHPVGLLFAISTEIVSDDDIDFPGVPPFGLSNPFNEVLDNLPKSTTNNWRMLLDPSQNTCSQNHAPSAPMNCKSVFSPGVEFASGPK